MPQASSIEWTEATSIPVTGCSEVSPGCAHCYAKLFAERWRGVDGHPYQQGFDLRLWPERLDAPLRWRKPRTIFVNSMSDLFHEDVPVPFIESVFETMEAADWHTFQVLTKRHDRLEELAARFRWPPNVWMGVTIENRRFVHRADALRSVPASVRFISAEPLLGPLEGLSLEGIDWLIAGGEWARVTVAWMPTGSASCEVNVPMRASLSSSSSGAVTGRNRTAAGSTGVNGTNTRRPSHAIRPRLAQRSPDLTNVRRGRRYLRRSDPRGREILWHRLAIAMREYQARPG